MRTSEQSLTWRSCGLIILISCFCLGHNPLYAYHPNVFEESIVEYPNNANETFTPENETKEDIDASFFPPPTSSWAPLGSGLNNTLHGLAFDANGNLYASGLFLTAGGISAKRIAKWDGTSWSALGSGLNQISDDVVVDANGNVYTGGIFSNAGGVPVNKIAKWDGSNWSALGLGVNGRCQALAVDGNGNLYAGGLFVFAGGAPANYIAKWDGTSWSPLGSGLGHWVDDIDIDQNGNVYVVGRFTTAGGSPASRVAKWDGTSWSALGSGVNGDCTEVEVDANGNVYVAGSFTTAGGVPASRVAKWDGTSWSALGSGLTGGFSFTGGLDVDAYGNVYVGGGFFNAGGSPANRIAKWDGTSWSNLGSGLNNFCRELIVDANGKVYAGGNFNNAGGVAANRIAVYCDECSPDTEKPTISCSSNFSQSTDIGYCDALVELPLPSASDNCGIDQVEFRYRPVDQNNNPLGPWSAWQDKSQNTVLFSVGRWKIRWRATDTSGNKKGCNQFMDIFDGENPDAKCKNAVVTLYNGNGSIISSEIDDGSTDNCGISAISFSSDINDNSRVFNCDDLGDTPLQLWVTDIYGNQNFCIANVSIHSGSTLTAESISLNEGTGAGVTFFFVKVFRSGDKTCLLSTEWQTVDGTATVANEDYIPNNGIHFWPPNNSTARYSIVRVEKDANFEPDETFDIDLFNGAATLVDGTQTIVNDDATPMAGSSSTNNIFTKNNFEVNQLDAQKGKQIGVFPNPVADQFHLITKQRFETGNARLFNAYGQLVLEQALNSFKKDQTISVNQFSSGVYWLEVVLDGKKFSEMLIVN